LVQYIYAQRITCAGEFESRFTIAAGADNDELIRKNASLAYNATNDEYFVVYTVDALSDQTHWEVWGRQVAWDGHWNGPEIHIFTWANRGFWYPKVPANSDRNEYLVVSDAKDTTTDKWNDAAGRVVLANGTMPNYHFAISIQDQTRQPHNAEVDYNPVSGEYLVVWDCRWTIKDSDIYGVRVDGDTGTAVNPPGKFAIDDTNVYQEDPSVAVDAQGHYLIVSVMWDPVSTYHLISGRKLDATGGLIGTHFPITGTSGIVYWPDVTVKPGTNEGLIIWEKWDETTEGVVWGATWETSTSEGSGSPFQISPEDSGHGAVGSGPAEYLVGNSQKNYPPSTYPIFGRLSWQVVNFLSIIMR